MLARLKDPAQRARAQKEMDAPSSTWENQWLGSGGGKGVMLVHILNPDLHKYEGMNLDEIGRQMGKDPKDAAMDIAIADRGKSQVVISIMDEADVRAAVSNPLVTFGSDSEEQAEDGPLSTTKAHPRAFGTMTRVLAEYVRKDRVAALPDAIRRLSSLPATNLGIRQRGSLKRGYYADVVVFDPARVQDHATFAKPKQLATGIDDVFINGVQVLRHGQHTGAKPGRFVRGPGWTGWPGW